MHACEVASVMSESLQPYGLQPTRLLCVHGISQDKNTGVGYHFPLQGIFLAQGSNLHLLRLLPWQVSSSPQVPASSRLQRQALGPGPAAAGMHLSFIQFISAPSGS